MRDDPKYAANEAEFYRLLLGAKYDRQAAIAERLGLGGEAADPQEEDDEPVTSFDGGVRGVPMPPAPRTLEERIISEVADRGSGPWKTIYDGPGNVGD